MSEGKHSNKGTTALSVLLGAGAALLQFRGFVEKPLMLRGGIAVGPRRCNRR
jgi:hypothetical protein